MTGTGRPISSEELLAARDAVTQHYVDAGYVTSGAVVPDQKLEDGLVRIQVVEVFFIRKNKLAVPERGNLKSDRKLFGRAAPAALACGLRPLASTLLSDSCQLGGD